MEVIFPLRAQTQYWISLEAFSCVWNLSPISPPDTDDFHRAAGETACAGVCPLCGKRGKSALIGLYIHIRQRGCNWSSQRRVTPTQRGNCMFYCSVLSAWALDWLAVWAALAQRTFPGPFAVLSVVKLGCPEMTGYSSIPRSNKPKTLRCNYSARTCEWMDLMLFFWIHYYTGR